MNSDLGNWLTAIKKAYAGEKPDMSWANEITEPISGILNDQFESFHKFIDFPIHSISLDLIVEAQFLSNTEEFIETSKKILKDINNFDFSYVQNFALIALALRSDIKLLNVIPQNTNIQILVWCLGQCVEINVEKVAKIWDEVLMRRQNFDNRVDMQAIILLMELIAQKWVNIEIPPLESDKYESIFALSFCNSKINVRNQASFVLPQLMPLVAESAASHLFFRRMLPYCAMENKEGRNSALDLLEQIVGHHSNFPSCVSTWIAMHPYCVAASNNLLVDMERKGLISTQMKPLLKHIMRINKLMLKNKISLTQETRMDLPRSLWRVEFPPPKTEVNICNNTCKLIYRSYESKWKTIIPMLLILIVSYLLYLYL